MVCTGLYSTKAKKLLNIFVNAKDIDGQAISGSSFIDKFSRHVQEIVKYGVVRQLDTGEIAIANFNAFLSRWSDESSVFNSTCSSTALRDFAKFIKAHAAKHRRPDTRTNAQLSKCFTSRKALKRGMKIEICRGVINSAGYYADDKIETVDVYDIVLLHDILAGKDLSRWSKKDVDKMIGVGLNPIQYEMVKSLDEEIKSMKKSLKDIVFDMENQMTDELTQLKSKWQDKIVHVKNEWHNKIAEASKLRRQAKSKKMQLS